MIIAEIICIGILCCGLYFIWKYEFSRKEPMTIKRIPVRNIPDSYFKGFRRLAKTRSEVTEQKCWTCKHAVAYRTWHCDLPLSEPCKYEMCYIKDEISIDDYNAAGEEGKLFFKWLSLPPPEQTVTDKQE